MPNYEKFGDGGKIDVITVNPKFWKPNIKVETTYGFLNGRLYLFWRIKNTRHVFRIISEQLEVLNLTSLHEHITWTLEGFREIYLGWKNQKITTKWMTEYYDMYDEYII